MPDAELQPALDRRHVADAAAELHRQVDRGEDRLDRRRVGRAPFEGAIEIDQVDPLEAGVGKAARLGSRIFVERSEEHTSELQSLMRTSYAVFGLKKKKYKPDTTKQ